MLKNLIKLNIILFFHFLIGAFFETAEDSKRLFTSEEQLYFKLKEHLR